MLRSEVAQVSTKTLQVIGGEKFIQSDWNETNPLSPLYIKNKPGISSNFTGSYYDLKDRPDLSIYAIADNVKIIRVTIPAASWVGTGPYSQTLDIDSATESTKLDIQADEDTLATILSKGYCLSIKNDGGQVTVHAIGTKPTVDLNVQILSTVVKNDGQAIWGNPIIGSGGGIVVSTTAPENTNLLWVDTVGGLKYYNGSAWVVVPVAYS